MKYKFLSMLFVLLFIIVFSSCADNSTIKINTLQANEKLAYQKHNDPNDINKIEIVITTTGKQVREIFKYSGYGFWITNENQSKDGNWITFLVTTQKGNSITPSNVELWYVDGLAGFAKRLYLSINIGYSIDTSGQIICIYDFLKSKKTPTIDLYKFPSMEYLQTVQVPEFTDKGTAPDSMTFLNNKFIIELSNDGPDYKTIEIPIK